MIFGTDKEEGEEECFQPIQLESQVFALTITDVEAEAYFGTDLGDLHHAWSDGWPEVALEWDPAEGVLEVLGSKTSLRGI